MKTWRKSAGKFRNKHLAYVMGVYMGDGCATYSKCNNTWRFKLKVIDKEFMLKTQASVFMLLGKSGWTHMIDAISPRHKPLHEFIVDSKYLVKLLKKITRCKTRIPEYIKVNKEYRRAFIEGYMDSEGFVGKTKRDSGKYQYQMGVASTDLFIDTVVEMMKKEGIVVGSLRIDKNDRGFKPTKMLRCYKINTLSWINSGLMFSSERKASRLRSYEESLRDCTLGTQNRVKIQSEPYRNIRSSAEMTEPCLTA